MQLCEFKHPTTQQAENASRETIHDSVQRIIVFIVWWLVEVSVGRVPLSQRRRPPKDGSTSSLVSENQFFDGDSAFSFLGLTHTMESPFGVIGLLVCEYF